jgi:hypothetical protein
MVCGRIDMMGVWLLLTLFVWRFFSAFSCDNYLKIDTAIVSSYEDLIDAINCEVLNITIAQDIVIVNQILIVNQTVTITSEAYSSLIASDSRILFIQNSNVSLSNLEFHGGEIAGDGGAILSERSTVSLKNSRIYHGKASRGGGISLIDSIFLIDQTIVEESSAHESGGGIDCRRSHLSIQNSFLTNNTASSGGSIASDDCLITLNDSSLSNSTAQRSGGCLSAIESSEIILIKTNLSFCRVELSPSQLNEVSQGGCVFGSNVLLSFTLTEISNCFAALGSAFRLTETQLLISQSNIHHNFALSCTLLIIGVSSDLTILDSNLYSNK